jgi:molybdopterin molybdotransferase
LDGFAWVDAWPPIGRRRRVATVAAAGLVLAREIRAAGDGPPETRAGRDGLALSAKETLGAGDYNPLIFRVLDGGQGIGPGQALEVEEGDPLPAGADAVLDPEHAERSGDRLEVLQPLAAWEGVVPVGCEWRLGEALASAGSVLRPQDLARLALARVDEVEVVDRPRVRLVLAGRFEHDADGPMLRALIAREGGALIEQQVAADAVALADALSKEGVDLILVAGGGGRSATDPAAEALARSGSLDIDGLSIHPGGSVILGQAGGIPVLVLPGAPLGCLCAFDLVAARLLRRLGRRPWPLAYPRRELTLGRKLSSRIGRLELARVRVRGEQAEPVAVAEGKALVSAVDADGFVLIPPASEGYPAGERVEVYLYAGAG